MNRANLIFLLILLVFTLANGQSYEQKEAYFKKLLAIQKKMKESVSDLQQINHVTQTKTQSLKGYTALQQTVLQSGIRQQRQIIEQTFKQTQIPFHENYWTCKELTNQQKSLIQDKIHNLKDKVHSIKGDLQTQQQQGCQRNTQLKHHVNILQLHIQSLQNQLTNICQPPTRKDKKLVSNLGDTEQNWIWGGLDPKEYSQNLQNKQKDFQIAYCPEDKPFLKSNQCIACENQDQIYNLKSQQCITQCPEDFVFLKQNHQCHDPEETVLISSFDPDSSDIPYIWGPITPQQYDRQMEQLKQKGLGQICPQDRPIALDDKCIQECQDLYNIGLRTCDQCQNSQKYVQEDHNCKKIIKKPNQKANDWITDDGNRQEYDRKLQEYQNNNFPVQQCPQDRPYPTKDLTQCVSCDKLYNLETGECVQCNKYYEFKDNQCVFVTSQCQNSQYWTGKKCIRCQNPGKYDNNQRTCVCPEGQKYHAQTGKCYNEDPLYRNPTITNNKNYVGQAPQQNPFSQNCPHDRPFFNQQQKKCVACQLPNKYYDFDNDECLKCGYDQEFSVQRKQCVQAINLKNSNLGGIDNYCCGQPTQNKEKENCPRQKPYFNGKDCIACSYPQYFDFSSYKCKHCPAGQAFSAMVKECVLKAYLMPKYKSNTGQTGGNYYGQPKQPKPQIQGQQIRQCPSDRPYAVNQQSCIKCQLPHYFNIQTSQCQYCKQGYSFDLNSRKCLKNTLSGDFYNSNMIGAQNFIGKVPQYKKFYPECDSNQRYFDGLECISCQLPHYFNFDTKQCQLCKQQTHFDTYFKQCIYNQGSFVTNPKAENIYYNGDFEKLKRQLQDDPTKKCPMDKPFYNMRTDECIQCGGDNDIFNYRHNHCMRCPDETHFNKEYHICFHNGVKPTIQRMMMNSATWI